MSSLTVVAAMVAAEDANFWKIALGIGAVVVAVVIALLTLLLTIVKEIEEGVVGVWETAKRLAANTATSWQLNETAVAVDALQREVKRHDELLGMR